MMNSSDTAVVVPLTALGKSMGFRPDPRFAALDRAHEPARPGPDAVELARAQGFADGLAQGRSLAAAEAAETLAAHGRLSLSFERLDHAMEEDLRLALRETVSLLCEGVLAPLALDHEALLSRIDKAVAMLSRNYDERTIRLNPEDTALLADRFRADWRVQPDPSLERGALRVESTEGGIEDGPGAWRRAIAEALGQC